MKANKVSSPLMIDCDGLSLTAADRVRIAHPFVGGVILFTRNFQDKNQLSTLVQEIRSIKPDCLIAVDQEGGRVQRFQQGFSSLLAARTFGERYDEDPSAACDDARRQGELMAGELKALDIDLSFAPVVDLDYGNSEIIGSRSFHHNPQIVARLAEAYIAGMKSAGMPAVAKHFPGHGFVAADSHLALPQDPRPLEEIKADLIPYQHLIPNGLWGVMPAHVVYAQHDKLPACFSPYWLQTILKEQLKFDGFIFSDDLSMAGAAVMGNMPERVDAALEAGCDWVLICNDPDAVDSVLVARK
jgi:beta-N-acetylhexosaminidase